MNQGWIYRDRIRPQQAGMTVLDLYCQHYRHSSRSLWQRRIESGQIWLNDRPAVATDRLQTGDRLAYHRPPWAEPPVPLDFASLYEDGDLLAIAKPSGLPVLPGGGFVEHTLLHQLARRYPQPVPVPVHRLGRGTSGVLLLARTPLARSHLSRQFREATRAGGGDRSVGKFYRALIGPCDLPDQFAMTTPIGPLPHPRLGTVHGATPAGKPAYSEARILERRPEGTLLEVSIQTGRPHQIRIHLAAAGYPLLGEPLYAPGGRPRLAVDGSAEASAVPGDGGYHLHSHRLRFLHPRSDRPLEICCPPPPLLQTAAEGLLLSSASGYP